MIGLAWPCAAGKWVALCVSRIAVGNEVDSPAAPKNTPLGGLGWANDVYLCHSLISAMDSLGDEAEPRVLVTSREGPR